MSKLNNSLGNKSTNNSALHFYFIGIILVLRKSSEHFIIFLDRKISLRGSSNVPETTNLISKSSRIHTDFGSFTFFY